MLQYQQHYDVFIFWMYYLLFLCEQVVILFMESQLSYHVTNTNTDTNNGSRQMDIKAQLALGNLSKRRKKPRRRNDKMLHAVHQDYLFRWSQACQQTCSFFTSWIWVSSVLYYELTLMSKFSPNSYRTRTTGMPASTYACTMTLLCLKIRIYIIISPNVLGLEENSLTTLSTVLFMCKPLSWI